MDEQKHRIGRQVLELTIPDREDAMSIQNSTSNLVKYKLKPALDRLFSSLTTSDDILRIDRLELDLGDVSKDKFEEEMVARTVEVLENKLTALLLEQQAAKESTYKPSESEDTGTKLISKPESEFDRLIHYLRSGLQPWWQDGDEKLTLGELLTESISKPRQEQIVMISQLLSYDSVRKRIALQLDAKQFTRFLSSFAPQKSDVYSPALSKMDPEKLPDAVKAGQLLRYHLLDILQQQEDMSEREIIFGLSQKFTLDYLDEKDPKALQKKVSGLLKHFSRINIPDELKKRILGQLVFISKTKILNLKVSDQKILGKFFTDGEMKTIQILANREKDTSDEFIARDLKDKTQSTGIEEDEKIFVRKEQEQEDRAHDFETIEELTGEETASLEDLLDEYEKEKEIRLKKSEEPQKPTLNKDGLEIFVQNAGLILLHPFLPYLFDGLDLLNKEKRFTDEYRAFRAVHILQYLATNETATPEHELTLNKIMCGIEPDEPIPLDVQLTEAEKEECINLLHVVLERWEALKTSKPEVLQEGFLTREGRLSFKGNGWNLFIERTTLDIMLDKLPWSISMIKMPWRDDLIYVEW
jgi:hypothetical protein